MDRVSASEAEGRGFDPRQPRHLNRTGIAATYSPALVGRLLLVLTAIGWGLGWPMMKLVMLDWPPLFARGTAGVAAAAGLFLFAAFSGNRILPSRRLMGPLALSAGINVFAWMGFTALSLRWLQVSEAALLTFTMPIWATLLAWPLRGERPTWRSLVALCLGLGGLLLLMGANVQGSLQKLPGVAFALAAAVLFALGTVTSRRPIPLPPNVLTAWLVGLGSLAMAAVGWAVERPELASLTPAGAGAIAYMAVGPMALCYLAWFGATRRLPTTTASTGLLIVPVVGAVGAAVMLGEPLGLRETAAFALTLGGVSLELGRR